MRGYVSRGLGGGYSLLSAMSPSLRTGRRNTGGLARMSMSTCGGDAVCSVLGVLGVVLVVVGDEEILFLAM